MNGQQWRKFHPRGHWQPWLISILATLWIGLLYWLQVLPPFEHVAYQRLFQWRGPLTWDDRIVLVKIDELSLRQLGPFPWPRDRYTQLLNILTTAQPNVVVFDLIFAESTLADPLFASAMRDHQQVVIASAWNERYGDWEPNNILRQAAIGTGHILYEPDSDGLVRCIPTWIQRLPTLSLPSLQTYRLFGAAPALSQRQSQLCPNWIGPSDQLPQYAFVDILNGQVNPDQFRHKIVLIGVTAAGVNPLMTPFDQSPPTSGVYLQATLLNNLLQQNLLRPIRGWPWVGLLLLSNLFWSVLLWQQKTYQQLVGSMVLVASWWLTTLMVLQRWHYWLPIVIPPILWLSTVVMHWIIANIQLEVRNRRLRYLANIDELTQVANRRAFEQYLQQEWQRSLREQQPISLILCDADFFKQFNDSLGHRAGDTCLYQIAQVLNLSTKRPTDMVARYGGEEFAIILPNTDAMGVQKLTNIILSQMRAQLIPHPASEISHYVTLSLGSATTIPNPQINWYHLVDAADRALYLAKSQGRDRACHVALDNPEVAPLPV